MNPNEIRDREMQDEARQRAYEQAQGAESERALIELGLSEKQATLVIKAIKAESIPNVTIKF